jgi:anti-sigma B factor antagonist
MPAPFDQLMTVTRTDRAGCPVLTVHGEVDLSTGPRLSATMTEVLLHGGHSPVILDLSTVVFLSSSGLGQLVALDNESKLHDRQLRIVVGTGRAVVRPITATCLDAVLAVFTTVDDALAAGHRGSASPPS